MSNRSNILLVGNTTIGTNLGGGTCVFKCKDGGNNLQFKTLCAGTGISMSATATVINICSTASGGTGGGIGWSNLANGSTVAGCGGGGSGGGGGGGAGAGARAGGAGGRGGGGGWWLR